MPRSARAMPHAPGQRREIQLIAAAPRQVSEARISRETRGRKQLARLKAIVLHGHAVIRSPERSAARHRGLRSEERRVGKESKTRVVWAQKAETSESDT